MPFFIARGDLGEEPRGAVSPRESSVTVDKHAYASRDEAVRAAEAQYAGERWRIVEAPDARTAAFVAAGVRRRPAGL